jgi:hypothetical protein
LIIPCGDDLFPIVHIPKIGGLPGRGRPYFNSGRGDAPNVAPKLEVPVNPSLVGTYFFCDTAANTAAASTNRGAWRHSPRSFVLRQSAHSHSPSGLILEIHVGEGLSIPVADAEAFGGFIDLPRWCEGAASGHGAVKNIAGTKSTAPAIDFAFTLNNRDGNLASSFPRRRRKGRVGAQTFSGWHLYCEGSGLAEHWAAATTQENAIPAVGRKLGSGWTLTLAEDRLASSQLSALKMRPNTVRKL